MLHHFFRQNPRSSSRKKEYDFGDARPIGEGGSGQVMRAIHRGTGKRKDGHGECVAVKVVRKEAIVEQSEYLKILHE